MEKPRSGEACTRRVTPPEALRGLSAEPKKKPMGERECYLLLPKKEVQAGLIPQEQLFWVSVRCTFSLPGFNDSRCHLSKGAEQA